MDTENEKLTKKIHKYVTKNPGVTAEEINTACNVFDGARVSYLLGRLKEGKYLKSKGMTRATSYEVTKKELEQ